MKEKPLHSQKCVVWCAISPKEIDGLFWLEDADGKPQTVDAEGYRTTVLEPLWRALGIRRAIQCDTTWFQKDEAPAHTANVTLEWLSNKFGNRVISSRSAHIWAPYSPDLAPNDRDISKALCT